MLRIEIDCSLKDKHQQDIFFLFQTSTSVRRSQLARNTRNVQTPKEATAVFVLKDTRAMA